MRPENIGPWIYYARGESHQRTVLLLVIGQRQRVLATPPCIEPIRKKLHSAELTPARGNRLAIVQTTFHLHVTNFDSHLRRGDALYPGLIGVLILAFCRIFADSYPWKLRSIFAFACDFKALAAGCLLYSAKQSKAHRRFRVASHQLSHFEADDCPSLNAWLAAAPNPDVICRQWASTSATAGEIRCLPRGI
jgi:hypothetical protein